jgi:hypothetical protein
LKKTGVCEKMEKKVGIKRDAKLKEIYASRLSKKKQGVGYQIICKIDKIETFDLKDNEHQVVLVTTETINEINTGCDMDMNDEIKITFPGVDNLVIKPLASVKLIAGKVGSIKM